MPAYIESLPGAPETAFQIDLRPQTEGGGVLGRITPITGDFAGSGRVTFDGAGRKFRTGVGIGRGYLSNATAYNW